ncbi:BnaAnng18800D [Brassica napus]|uniref:BnaAnng18800D protein n=1 Tax=Brassica napus TaxID=3708 RepID=A0A078JB88_BRANA|nr:BnaAnng18800D [Brassica napus]
MQGKSAPEGGEGHQKWVGAPPVGYESGQTSNQNDGERLEQVSAPMGFVEALVKEINSEIPGADEEIRATRGGEGAQPKENESVAARMTPTTGIDFAQKTGADNGGESGQTSNQNDGERLEQVSAPMGFVEALVKEINSEIPGADEEIRATRGGEGAQPKENESVAARMTPTAGIDFAQKTGADNGGEFVEEDPDSGEEARTADKQPQSVDSVETSNMEFSKPVEAVGKVAPPKAGVEASVKEINAELQGTEDEERYDSCKDDMSTDSQIQENPRDLCGETDADSEDVGSGGKRHRMRSSRISGVYTPDPRVKKLFKSEEKVEYKPIAKTNRTQFKKFPEILRENPEQMWDIATGHSVCNHFFFEIAEPGKLMSDEHMHVIMNMLWRRRGIYLQKERMVILDQYFIKTIQSNWSAFSADNDKLQFEWGKNVAQYVTGKSKGQKMKLGLGRDVDTVYTPMNWGGDHWVGLCIKLIEGHVTVFDSYVPHTEIEVKEGLRIYSWSRAEGIYHNKRGGDCGPCAAKFIEMHAAGLTEEMSRITDKDVDRFREQYAMDCYEEFLGDAKVNNE